jgi:hypothetical protein
MTITQAKRAQEIFRNTFYLSPRLPRRRVIPADYSEPPPSLPEFPPKFPKISGSKGFHWAICYALWAWVTLTGGRGVRNLRCGAGDCRLDRSINPASPDCRLCEAGVVV